MVAAVRALDENTVEVTLKDGRVQRLAVSRMEQDDTTVRLTEYRDGQVTVQELASGR
ncbi:hypothetical protein D3C73_1653440 [compost metagenome]